MPAGAPYLKENVNRVPLLALGLGVPHTRGGPPATAGELSASHRSANAPRSSVWGAHRDTCASPGLLTRTPASTRPVWWSGNDRSAAAGGLRVDRSAPIGERQS